MQSKYPTSWNLSLIYESDDDPRIEKDREKTDKNITQFIEHWNENPEYLKDPEVLAKALKEYSNIFLDNGIYDKEAYYLYLKQSLNQDDSSLKAKINKLEEKMLKFENEIQFFTISVAKIDKKEQGKFLEYEGLRDYRHFLERLFDNQKYILSEKEERILNFKGKTSYANWVDMVERFLSREYRKVLNEDEKEEKKSLEEILGLLNSRKKNVRDRAAKTVHSIMKKYTDIAEVEMNSILENHRNNDEIRGFTRPDEFMHIEDDIDTKIVDTLRESVSSRFDIPHRYYKLKAQLMGVSNLAYHERMVPLMHIKSSLNFDESVALVSEVLGNLDSQFLEIFKNLVNNGNIDVYPKKGKSSGGYCISGSKTLPTYILLNHNNKFEDLTTIAHETGHAINGEMMKATENPLNYGTPTCIAETSSTFFEDFILEDYLKKANDEERLAIYMQKLNGDVGAIFKQIAAYNFEFELHQQFREKGYLSKKEIGVLFRKHMSACHGEYVSEDRGSENWWVNWSHFRLFFYVYSYASGLLISKALQGKYKQDKSYIQKIKKFLSTGTSVSPLELFKSLDIDILDSDFWSTGINEIDSLLNEAESLAKKLGKI
jgi:oligoendopeptidase F